VTIHLHLVIRLRMRGAIPPFPQYELMAWCLINQKILFHACICYTALNERASFDVELSVVGLPFFFRILATMINDFCRILTMVY
jgi:hypothetical protein